MNLRITILLFIAVLVGLAIAGARSRAQDGKARARPCRDAPRLPGLAAAGLQGVLL